MSGGTSYYKTIKGVKYDRGLLQQAEEFTKAGPMSEKDAKALWEDAEDGPGVTPTEHKTLEYIKDNFKLDPAATKFLEGKLGGQFVTIDGEQYKKSIIEGAAEGEKCNTLADAKELWKDANDDHGTSEIGKKSLEKVLKDNKFSKEGEEFLRTALEGHKGEKPLLGKRVEVHGTSQPEYNGKVGVASSWDADKERYVVDLDNTKSAFRFKPTNLKPEDPNAKAQNEAAKIPDLEKKVADAEKAKEAAEKKSAEAQKEAAKVPDLEKKLADADKAKKAAEKMVADLQKEVDILPEKLKLEIEKWEEFRVGHEKQLIQDFCAKEVPQLKKQRTS